MSEIDLDKVRTVREGWDHPRLTESHERPAGHRCPYLLTSATPLGPNSTDMTASRTRCVMAIHPFRVQHEWPTKGPGPDPLEERWRKPVESHELLRDAYEGLPRMKCEPCSKDAEHGPHIVGWVADSEHEGHSIVSWCRGAGAMAWETEGNNPPPALIAATNWARL